MVPICVDMPERPGGIGADLRPEAFDVAATIRVIWGAADRNLGVADYGAAV